MRRVVLLTATYCPHCKALERDISVLRKRYPKRVEIIQADKNYAQALKYGQIKHVPVLVMIDNEQDWKENNFPTVAELVEWFKSDKR